MGLQEKEVVGTGMFSPEEGFEVLEFGTDAARRCAEYLEAEKFRGPGSLGLVAYVDSEKAAEFEAHFKHSKIVATLLSAGEKASEDYLQKYRDSVQGCCFGEGLWVGPPWREAPMGSEAFFVEPGLAFGTGDHPTTQLCLSFLHELKKKGEKPKTILDVGTGSGILALAAQRFFPKAEIFVNDLDPLCENEVIKTFSLNGGDWRALQQDFSSSAPLKKLPNQSFDLVISNIYAEVLATLVPDMTQLLRPEARSQWICSGILAGGPEEGFKRVLAPHFQVVERRSQGRESVELGSQEGLSPKVENWVGLRLSLGE